MGESTYSACLAVALVYVKANLVGLSIFLMGVMAFSGLVFDNSYCIDPIFVVVDSLVLW